MIHSIILPGETETVLNETVNVLIECCELLKQIADGTQTRAGVGAFFAAKYPPERARWLTRWLRGSDLPWMPDPAVKQWLTDAITDMQALLIKDRTIALAPRGHTPFIPRREDRSAWANKFHDFFVGLYKSMRSQSGGLNPHLCGTPKKFTGQNFYDNFRKANPRLRMCPVCETDTFAQKFSDEKYKGQIDHYFPKSHYPHLALHAHNLLPICRTCNEERGSKPPVMTNGWRSAWLPYDAPLMNSYCFHEGNGAGPQLHCFGAATPHPDAIATVQKCYDIPARWREALRPAEEVIFARLKDYFTGHHPPSLDVLEGALEVLLHDTIDLDFGNLPHAFVQAGLINRFLEAEVRPAIAAKAPSCALADNLSAKRPAPSPGTRTLRTLYATVTY